MGSSMKSKNKLERVTNFRAWKTRIDLILVKNDLLGIVKVKVTEPSYNEGKIKYEKDSITTRSIIADSIKDHLIPYVANLDLSKMYDALVGLYTINNIGQKMSLKNELRNIKMTKVDLWLHFS